MVPESAIAALESNGVLQSKGIEHMQHSLERFATRVQTKPALFWHTRHLHLAGKACFKPLLEQLLPESLQSSAIAG